MNPASLIIPAFETPGLFNLVSNTLNLNQEQALLADQEFRKYITVGLTPQLFNATLLEFAKAGSILWRFYKANPQINPKSARRLAESWRYILSQSVYYEQKPTRALKEAMLEFKEVQFVFKNGDLHFIHNVINSYWVTLVTSDRQATPSDLRDCANMCWFHEDTVKQIFDHPSSDLSVRLELSKMVRNSRGLNWALSHQEIYSSSECLAQILQNFKARQNSSDPIGLPWLRLFETVPHHLWPLCMRSLLEVANTSGIEDSVHSALRVLEVISGRPGVQSLSASDLQGGILSKNKDIRLASIKIIGQLNQVLPVPSKAPKTTSKAPSSSL